MAIAEELQIIVDAKVSQAVKDMKKVDRSIDSTSKTASKLKNSLKSLAGPVAIGAVIAGAIKLGKEVEDAFQVQEKAVAGVNAALKATGQFTSEAAQDIQDFASSLQEVTTVGDETTLSMIQTAINMGLTAEQAKEATKQAIGMSEAYGVGLDTALRGTANATLGNYEALTRYLPAIKTANDDAEKAAIVQKQLGDAFAIAEANAKTSSGVQAQLSNSYGDLQETIGQVISQAITPYRANLKKEVESVNQSIKAHILRKKAIAGNATLVENLTLREIEQEKAEAALAQAVSNVEAAENQVLDTRYLSEQQIIKIEAAKAEAVKRGQETIKALEGEVAATTRATEATRRQVEEENQRIDTNIRLTQGMNEVTTETDENTGSIDDNTTALSEGVGVTTSWREAVDQSNESLATYRALLTDAATGVNEVTDAIEKSTVSWEEYASAGLGALSAIDSLSSSVAANELQRLKDSGASEEELDKKKKRIAHDEAIRKKALGLLSVSIDTASAIIGFLADPGGTAGIVLSALAGVTGGIQAAAIASTPVPAFAQGGTFTTNGPQQITVGDNAGGIEEVTVRPVSSAGNNESFGGGNQSIVIMIDGEEFTSFMQKKIDNRALRSSLGGAI
jgi:hypothetical protein